MNVRILSCAEQELSEAVDYYNTQCPGLGYEFAAEVQQTLTRITEFPEAWPSLSARSRRCLTRRFPYGILYQVRRNEILVLAVMHMKQDPRKWQQRIREQE